jgi:heptosyltransferase-1
MFATPIVRALRTRYPGAHLTWVVEPAASDVVKSHPELDEVIVWDRPRWKQLARERRYGELWQAFREFRAQLRARRFDLAIDMQGLLRSGLVAWFTRAPVRVVLGPQEGSGIVATHRYPTGRAIEGMSAEPKLMAEWLGLDTSGWALDLWKHWVERRWAALARLVKETFDLPVVLAGAPADRQAADRILAGSGGDLIDLVGKTSLTEAVAVVSEAALVIGVDTALTHAAHGFLRPTVCVFGPAGYSDPPTPMSRMARHWLGCVPCRAAGSPLVCGGAYTCMDLISVQEVAGHARALLERYPPGASGEPSARAEG